MVRTHMSRRAGHLYSWRHLVSLSCKVTQNPFLIISCRLARSAFVKEKYILERQIGFEIKTKRWESLTQMLQGPQFFLTDAKEGLRQQSQSEKFNQLRVEKQILFPFKFHFQMTTGRRFQKSPFYKTKLFNFQVKYLCYLRYGLLYNNS